MDAQRRKQHRSIRRKQHVRKKVQGTPERPCLSVFRSAKHIYAQLIDDLNGLTLASASTAGKSKPYGGNVKAATEVGKALAAAATAKGIQVCAFDRGPYRYHGRLKALAEAAREGGLKF